MPVPIWITIPRLHPIQSQYQCRCQQQYNNIILNIINIKNIDIRADIDNNIHYQCLYQHQSSININLNVSMAETLPVAGTTEGDWQSLSNLQEIA